MTGRTPPAVFNSSTAPIDQDWVDAELIPFLQRVYPEERKTTMEWNRQVVLGRAHLDWLDQYQDFPFTIERLRLCLLNSELLTPAEMSQFIPVTERGSLHCLRIFIRHAIVHGSYMLYSLGDDPSPEFPRAGHTSTRPSITSPAEPAPARATSVAVLEARNATLERELASLQAERGRGNGRGNGRGRGRPSQPRGDFVGRSDRGGGRFNQGPNAPPNIQQPPSQFPSIPPPGMYGYPAYQYGYGGPYMAAPPMGGYPMQPYQQQPFTNPGQQYGGGWTGSQMMFTAHQDYSSQTGASSGFAMPPPQQVSNAGHQGQSTQRARGSSGSQQGQGPASAQGRPTRPQQPSSGSGASTHVPRPDAEEFYPGSRNGYN